MESQDLAGMNRCLRYTAAAAAAGEYFSEQQQQQAQQKAIGEQVPHRQDDVIVGSQGAGGLPTCTHQ